MNSLRLRLRDWVIAIVVLLLGAAFQHANAQSQPRWEAFELADLVADQQDANVPVLTFLERDSMNASLLSLLPGDEDDRASSNLDQVYYVFSGSATLKAGESQFEIEPGMVVFARADHHAQFTHITESLTVVVAELKAPSSSLAPGVQIFEQASIEAPRNRFGNVWNPFLRRPNVVMGVYMLPQVAGGDGALTHAFDELNIVTRGASRFRMDADEIDVQQTSIVFVSAGVGHFFHSLNADIDILILWEQP